MTRQYDAMVKPRRFNIGNLILKRVSLATRNLAHGKLGPDWEGPYRVLQKAEIILLGSPRWTEARAPLKC